MQHVSVYHRVIGLAVATLATAALMIAVTPRAASASTTAIPPAGLSVTGEDVTIEHSTVTDMLGTDVDNLASDMLPNGTELRQDQIAGLLEQLTGELSDIELAHGLKLPLGLGL